MIVGNIIALWQIVIYIGCMYPITNYFWLSAACVAVVINLSLAYRYWNWHKSRKRRNRARENLKYFADGLKEKAAIQKGTKSASDNS